MNRFAITLKGVSPLMPNRMTPEAVLKLRDKTIKTSKSAPPLSLEEEASIKVHRNGDGMPCVPRYVLMAALINAGVLIRLDQKRQLSTKESSMLPGLLTLEGESFPLLKPGSGEESDWGYASWRYDVRQGRNPN